MTLLQLLLWILVSVLLFYLIKFSLPLLLILIAIGIGYYLVKNWTSTPQTQYYEQYKSLEKYHGDLNNGLNGVLDGDCAPMQCQFYSPSTGYECIANGGSIGIDGECFTCFCNPANGACSLSSAPCTDVIKSNVVTDIMLTENYEPIMDQISYAIPSANNPHQIGNEQYGPFQGSYQRQTGLESRGQLGTPPRTSEYCVNQRMSESGNMDHSISQCSVPGKVSEDLISTHSAPRASRMQVKTSAPANWQ